MISRKTKRKIKKFMEQNGDSLLTAAFVFIVGLIFATIAKKR